MHNRLFSIGPFTVYGYGLMTAIGIIAAYFLMEHLAKKKGLDKERVFWIIIWCLIFGYIGSKILYLITILPAVIEDPSIIKSSLRDGWVMYGGLLGGILGGFLYCRLRKLNAWAYFDIGLACVALAQGFGRIGCFLAGCCYGAQTDSAFCIVFHTSEFAPNNVPLIPTQLIMSAGDFLLFAFLMLYNSKKKKDGVVTGAYLTLYSLGRFIIEFFRGDSIRGSVGPLSTSQFIAVFVAVIGLIVWIVRARSNTVLFAGENDSASDTEKAEENVSSEDTEKADENDSAADSEETENVPQTENAAEDLLSDTAAESEENPSEPSAAPEEPVDEQAGLTENTEEVDVEEADKTEEERAL